MTARNPAYGWGIFAPADAVATDPTTLPDTNPVAVDIAGSEPSFADVTAATATASPRPDGPSASASPTTTPAPAPTAGAATQPAADGSGTPWALVGLGALAVARGRRRGGPRRAPPRRHHDHRGRPRAPSDHQRGPDPRSPRRRGGVTHGVQHDGGGAGFPPLPADAGPTERALYEIYDFQSGIVSYTASQWKTTADEITDLASSVRQVVRELRRAPDGGEAWSGTAAEAAYDSLGKLATNLDRHAEDILNIEAGLTAASDAVSDARSAYVTRVRTVDTDIDQAGYMTGPPPPPVGPPVPEDPRHRGLRPGRLGGPRPARVRGAVGDAGLRHADGDGGQEAARRAGRVAGVRRQLPLRPRHAGRLPRRVERRWWWGLHAAEAHLGRRAHRRRRRRRRRQDPTIWVPPHRQPRRRDLRRVPRWSRSTPRPRPAA